MSRGTHHGGFFDFHKISLPPPCSQTIMSLKEEKQKPGPCEPGLLCLLINRPSTGGLPPFWSIKILMDGGLRFRGPHSSLPLVSPDGLGGNPSSNPAASALGICAAHESRQLLASWSTKSLA